MWAFLAVALCAILPSVAVATETNRRGQVTDLPIPRYVSIKGGEANARRGPAMDRRIDWVFVRNNLPLKVTDEYGHWRRVEDSDGKGGWVHYSLLSGARSVVVTEAETLLRGARSYEATPVASLEVGVVANLERCQDGWCRLTVQGHAGWAPRSAIWGDGGEID